MQHMRHISQRGITIIEVMISIVIISMIMVIFSTIFINSYNDILISNAETTLARRTTQALSFIERDVRTARDFLDTTPHNYHDSYIPLSSSQWHHEGDGETSRVLILDQYATASQILSPNRLPVYTKGKLDCSDTDRKYYNPHLHYLSLYFVKDKTLYRRTLTDTSTPLCPGELQSQKQSCPPYIQQSSWHKHCQARDEIIATDVEEFAIQYHNQGGQIANAYTQTGSLADAEYITVRLRLKDATSKKSASSTLTQIMTKGND